MNPTLPDLDRDDGLCPLWGSDASWAFIDKDREWVEVACPNCGKIEMRRLEFEKAETELIEPEERT